MITDDNIISEVQFDSDTLNKKQSTFCFGLSISVILIKKADKNFVESKVFYCLKYKNKFKKLKN